MSQSKELTEFYRRYVAWVDTGSREGDPFYRDLGLCDNVKEISYKRHYSDVKLEMLKQFQGAGHKAVDGVFFPFNDGRDNYTQEAALHMSFANGARIKWCRDRMNPEGE